MTDVLDNIIETKKAEISALKEEFGFAEMEIWAERADPPRGFIEALKAASKTGYGLIAELKKASPSRGLIRADFNPHLLAKAYLNGGASCLSVLTDTSYFQGDDSYLVAARKTVNLPILRKDFIIDPLQIVQSRAMGADCILLIMSALSPQQAIELEDQALALGLDVLIEVHDEAELERACQLKSPLIGINNRNLKTLEISLEVSKTLLPLLPSDKIAVSESGLYTADDLEQMAKAGARCFLIGESLMRQADVAKATATLLANPFLAEPLLIDPLLVDSIPV